MKKKGTFRLGVRAHFDAAHFLRGHKGKCAGMHGHRWDVEVVFSSITSDKGDTYLDDLGMVVDFSDLKALVHEEASRYDHMLLNEHEPFTAENPTAENISYRLFCHIKEKLPEKAVLCRVTVWESPEQWASYEE